MNFSAIPTLGLSDLLSRTAQTSAADNADIEESARVSDHGGQLRDD